MTTLPFQHWRCLAPKRRWRRNLRVQVSILTICSKRWQSWMAPLRDSVAIFYCCRIFSFRIYSPFLFSHQTDACITRRKGHAKQDHIYTCGVPWAVFSSGGSLYLIILKRWQGIFTVYFFKYKESEEQCTSINIIINLYKNLIPIFQVYRIRIS